MKLIIIPLTYQHNTFCERDIDPFYNIKGIAAVLEVICLQNGFKFSDTSREAAISQWDANQMFRFLDIEIHRNRRQTAAGVLHMYFYETAQVSFFYLGKANISAFDASFI